MLISFLLFTKLFYPVQLKQLRLKNKINNIEDYRSSVILNVVWFSILVVFLLLNVVPAVLIAFNWNKNNIGHLIIAFLFSDIYLLQWSIKKFILKSENYCNI